MSTTVKPVLLFITRAMRKLYRAEYSRYQINVYRLAVAPGACTRSEGAKGIREHCRQPPHFSNISAKPFRSYIIDPALHHHTMISAFVPLTSLLQGHRS